VRYHGILAPCASGRDRVVPVTDRADATTCTSLGGDGRKGAAAEKAEAETDPPLEAEHRLALEGAPISNAESNSHTPQGARADRVPGPPKPVESRPPASARRQRLPWADLLQRMFGIEALRCKCGETMRVMATNVSTRCSLNALSAGIDGPSEYKWRTGRGMEWNLDITTVGKDMAYFMYASGPDHEIVEVWTGTPYQRYNHVHLLTKDVNLTRDWYIDNLGAKGPKTPLPDPGKPPAGMNWANPKVFDSVWQTQIAVDGVLFNIWGLPDEPVFWWPHEPILQFEKTDGHVIDHYAFSYPDIAPVFARMQREGVEIVKEIAWNEELQMKSFFVRAPDGVLVEIVEADPLPDASWLHYVRSEHE